MIALTRDDLFVIRLALGKLTDYATAGRASAVRRKDREARETYSTMLQDAERVTAKIEHMQGAYAQPRRSAAAPRNITEICHRLRIPPPSKL